MGLALWALAGTAAPAAALQSLPGPPLAGGAPEWGAACAAPRSHEGRWQAAGFGLAVLGVGWLARQRDPQD